MRGSAVFGACAALAAVLAWGVRAWIWAIDVSLRDLLRDAMCP
jgi:hypothetical protein